MHGGSAHTSAMAQTSDPADGDATQSAGECVGLCAGLEVAFLEAEGAVKEANWSYVGDGRGSYSVVPQYGYVGEGAGSFAPLETVTYHGWRFRKCFLAVLAALLLPACLYCMLWWLKISPSWAWKPNLPTTSAMPTYVLTSSSSRLTTAVPYDCNVDYVDCHKCLLERWSIGKLIWCCSHAQRGCDFPNATTSTFYDCSVGLTNWKLGWSDTKKSWCCKHGGKGCLESTTSSPYYDCNKDLLFWQTTWTAAKREWCCSHAKLGCLPTTPSTTPCPPHDCNAAFLNWKTAWSNEKKKWCCQHDGKGCMR